VKKWPLILWSILAALALFGLVGLSYAAQVTLQWDANNPTPDGYRLYQREHGGNYNYSAPSWTGTRTTATIYDLADNTEYYFVARAYVGTQESGNSNEVLFVSATPTPTPTPTPAPTVEPTPTPTATPAPPKGFVLLKNDVPIYEMAPGEYFVYDMGKLWIVTVQPDESQAPYSGNIITKTFHREGCRYHDCLSCTARFATPEEAVAQGYKPCGVCKP